MVSVGDAAPDFTAPVANGDIDEVTLSEAIGSGPIVLAFFPGAFTSVCSHEMNTFQDRLDELTEAGATLYGISIDTPFAQNAFRDELGIEFDLVSDAGREIVDAYDISMDFEALGVPNVAKRAVFVVDENREVTYAWVSDDPGVEPDYDEVIDAAT
jgi:peroxiredoxin